VLLDVPRTAVVAAATRIESFGMGATAEVVRGSGTNLPFRSAIFDAVAHSDTL
jgi:ubiquinone/menaquinone biosynthesis C-methylase UbiE